MRLSVPLFAFAWVVGAWAGDLRTQKGISLTATTCDCGYAQEDSPAVWTDMWHVDFRSQPHYKLRDIFIATYNITAKYEDTLDRVFVRQNVKSAPGEDGLRVAVTYHNQTLRCGGFGTKRKDFLYGSFRSFMRTTSVNGTVAAMYIYNLNEEIDIEILSAVTPPQSYFAIHPGLLENGRASSLTHDNHWLGFDPSQDYHEYRFDWLPGEAVFYIDGVPVKRMTTNIPSHPARLMFNHWSDGNRNFSRGPPEQDAYFDILNVTVFFNYSLADHDNTFLDRTAQPACFRSKTPCNIQSVLGQIHEREQAILSATPSPLLLPTFRMGSDATNCKPYLLFSVLFILFIQLTTL